MQFDDLSSPPKNQELLRRREQELKLEVAAAKLRAALAEYRLALLELALAEPALAAACAGVFRLDTGEELFSKPVQEQFQPEPAHAAKE